MARTVGRRNKDGTLQGTNARGNKDGRGGSISKKQLKFLTVTINTCSYSDWRKIVGRAIKQAIAGDSQARKFLANYILGVPTQKIEQDTTIQGDISMQGTLDLSKLSTKQLNNFLEIAEQLRSD